MKTSRSGAARGPLRSVRIWRMLQSVGAGLVVALTACAHHPEAPKPPLSTVAQRYAMQAEAIATPQAEEDFLEARLVFQALPVYAPQRKALRSRLVEYLLGPIEKLGAEDLKGDAEGLVNAEYDQQALSSFQDALGLFHPVELTGELELPASDRARLHHAAELVATVFGARGAEAESALSLAVLAKLEPKNSRWAAQLDEVLAWAEDGKQIAAGNAQLDAPPSPRRILESTAWSWPTPNLTRRLAETVATRYQQLTGRLRRPLGGGVHAGMFGEEMLEEADTVATLAPSLAQIYLRASDLEGASQALEGLRGKPGDNPDLRRLVDAVARNTKPTAEAFAALSRRFLPKLPLLGGTSTDRVDAWAAFRVLEMALRFHPRSADLLVLQSRVARLTSAPLLSLKLLEEVEPIMAEANAPRAEREALTKEMVELQFGLFRVRMDPEDVRPAQRHAEALRQRMADARRHFGDDAEWLSDTPVEVELARNYVDAGQPEKAQPILARAVEGVDAGADVTLQLGNLLTKKGDNTQAVRLLRDALERHQPEDPPAETIGYVETHSKLARALGQALELTGRDDDAQKAYRTALLGWERLMVDHMRNRRRGPAAEATLEVGRLYYLMGRREEALQKFSEAVEFDQTRDQTYSDALAFLVQRGELDAAVSIFRSALSHSGEAISEYVKVYASLWIQDLSRRSRNAPEPSAQAYLQFVARRKVNLRPTRSATWYRELSRFAIGEVKFEDLLSRATTPGRRAEIYFYEAMARLAQGREDDAHALWSRVLETNMVSFFEYEMASQYLRQGARSTPKSSEQAAETI